MQVGTTKDQGLYNKPSAAVHPGALAAGTLPQYNTIRSVHFVILYDSICDVFHVRTSNEILPSRATSMNIHDY